MPEILLEIRNLHVSVDGKEILKGIDLQINKGETHVLMGPNASGKTTLLMTLIGYPEYVITGGEIIFDGVKLNKKQINERAKMGLSVALQTPPEISH